METARIQLQSRYDIERELGGGAMGKVYLARDRLIDRQVVLKTLFSGGSGATEVDERERARLVEEARAAGRITHPNIVTVYDLLDDTDTQRLYLALEFVDGEPLNVLLRKRGSMPVREALEIAIQVAEGLEHLHGAGVIHRDIKPANILIDFKGQAKITDFGIARAAGGPQREADGSVYGTPPYMAPEQLTETPVDARADVFSLGAVLYEMLAGCRAFAGATVTEMARNTLHGELLSLEVVAPAIPADVSAMVARALHREPARRYPSTAALAQDLRQALQGLPDDGTSRDRGTAPLRSSGPVVGPSSSDGAIGDETQMMLSTRWRRWLRGETVPWTAAEGQRLRLVLLALGLALVCGLGIGWWLYGQLLIGGPGIADTTPDTTGQAVLPAAVERQLLVEGSRLLEEGEASAAVAIFALAERLSPGNAGAAALRVEAEAALAGSEPSDRADRAATRSTSARILAAPEPAEAIESTRQALGVATRERLAEVLGEVEEALAAPVSVEPVPPDRSRLEIELRSEVPRGRLVIYRESEQVAHEGFSFVRRKNLFRRERIEEPQHFSLDLEPGPAELRVMVVPRGQSARVAIVAVDAPAGQIQSLLIEQPEEGEPTLSWR